MLYSLRASLFKETKVRTKTEVRGRKGRNQKFPEMLVGRKEVEVGELIGPVQKMGKFSGLWPECCMSGKLYGLGSVRRTRLLSPA